MSKKNDELGGDLVAMLDQSAAQLENVAKLFGTFYKSMIESGVPGHVADLLVIELARKTLDIPMEYQGGADIGDGEIE